VAHDFSERYGYGAAVRSHPPAYYYVESPVRVWTSDVPLCALSRGWLAQITSDP